MMSLQNYSRLCFEKEAIGAQVWETGSNFSQTHEINTLADCLLREAIYKHASDIHLEAEEQVFNIRLRIMDEMIPYQTLDTETGHRLLAHIKCRAHCDISNELAIQDGQFTWQSGKHRFACRLAICPGVFGENMVIRLLPTHAKRRVLSQLGMSHDQLTQFKHYLDKTRGLILLIGPTGVGKSTTLYAALDYLSKQYQKICTIENPVEMTLPNVVQVNVNKTQGISFHQATRAFLRCDPDVIMIGEIRDQETAAIAIRAAQTGHCVLSTLHARNAKQAITRLMQLGLKRHQLENTISCIISQHLALCAEHDNERIGVFNITTNEELFSNHVAPTSTISIAKRA